MRMCYPNALLYSTNNRFREDEDEETAEWEQEQLRRGGHRTPEPSSTPKVKQVYKAAPSASIRLLSA